MKPWSEKLLFSKPLRDIRPKKTNAADAGALAASEEELRASYERGRHDAEKALTEELLKQRAEVHEMIGGVLKSLRESVPQIVRDTENSLIALALSIAQKLVVELPISAQMVEAVVRDALRQIEGAAQFTVRLHPADLELLQNSQSPLLAASDGAREFHFLSSPEVTRGGCLVQTQFGTVDARRETKLDLLQRTLLA
jgi:flagellar biosynthesis/type III secretory pathway protein FliH